MLGSLVSANLFRGFTSCAKVADIKSQFYLLDEARFVERFCDKAVGTKFSGFNDNLPGRLTGRDDDWNIL